jgi:acylphosphatase
MAENAKRIIIHGHVQGVGFRAFAVREAARYGVNGFVRNRADGTVEALAVGTAAEVEFFLAACRKGPNGARVEQVVVEAAQGVVNQGFRQLPTVDMDAQRR